MDRSDRRDSRSLPPLSENDSKPSKPKNKKKKELILDPSSTKNIHSSPKTTKGNVLSNNEIIRELEDIQEDIIFRNSENVLRQQLPSADKFIPSEPDGKLYVEKKATFKVQSKSNAEKKAKNQMTHLVGERWNELFESSSVHQAIFSHKIFKTIALFMNGLFSGLVLWQIISTFVLFRGGATNFLINYSPLSMPIQCCYYFFLTICIVSALDRYDIMSPSDDFCRRLITLQTGAICIFLYAVGLIISLSIHKIDSQVGWYHKNSSYWSNFEESYVTDTLRKWQALNLIRGCASILGWIIISLRPLTDRMMKSLNRLKLTNGQP